MNSAYLEIQISKARGVVEEVFDQLVEEIERLEQENNDLTDKVSSLEEKVEDLESDLSSYK